MIERDELFIGGKWSKPSSSERITVICPSTEEVAARVPAGSNEDINMAVTAARSAFDSGPWPRMGADERASYIDRIADHLVTRAEEIAQVTTLSNGSPISFSRPGAMGPIAMLRTAASRVRSFSFTASVEGLTRPAQLVYEPAGVVAAIAPWNGPLYLSVSKLAPALAAGCTVVLKPAPETPLDGYILAEACADAGLPEGVVSIVAAGREVGQCLVENPMVDKVAFTGSTAAGHKVMAACAQRMARVSLELGGKSAAIVLDDAECATFIPQLVPGSMMLSGQACALLSRVLVPRTRHDEIVEAFCAAVSKLKMGDPFDEATNLGPLVAERQRERVEGYIALGQQEGAKVAMGGGRAANMSKGWYVEPTVFAQVDNEMRIAQEEIFGPVVCFIPYDTEADAIAMANQSAYGLHGAVFTSDEDRGYTVGRQVRTGSFTINGFGLDPEIPFGGFKQSGIGREGNAQGFGEYLELKAITYPEGFVPPA